MAEYYSVVVEQCSRWGYDEPLHNLLQKISRDTGVQMSSLQQAQKLAVWRQDIDHDLTQRFEPWSPLIPGGRVLREKLKTEWCSASGVPKNA